MDMSFSSNSLLQLQSELGTSCSGLSEQDYFGSGQGFRGYAAFERFTLVRELNSAFSIFASLAARIAEIYFPRCEVQSCLQERSGQDIPSAKHLFFT